MRLVANIFGEFTHQSFPHKDFADDLIPFGE